MYVSCASGIIAQIKQSLAGAGTVSGHWPGNFTFNDPGCYTTGAPITLSFGGKNIRSLGFNVQSCAPGAFTARLRYYSGEGGTGTLLQTHTVNGNSTQLENGSAVFLAGVSDSGSTDFKSVRIDLTAANSDLGIMAINNVSFRDVLLPTVHSLSAYAFSENTAALSAVISANDRPTTGYYNYGPTAALGTIVAFPGGTVTVNDWTVQQALAGLTAGQTIHIRAEAENTGGRTLGPIQTYTHFGSGSRDFTFSGDGVQTTPFIAGGLTRAAVAYAVVVQPDGKIVTAGYAGNGSNEDFSIARYNADGTLDTTFGTAGTGMVTTPVGSGNDRIHKMALQPDGKIVVAGQSWNGSHYVFAVARYNVNGSLDMGPVTTAFGAADAAAYGVAVQADGKIVVSGAAVIGGNYDFAVARYNSNGSLDNAPGSFGTGGKVTTAIGSYDYGQMVAVQPDGKIVVAGHSQGAGVGYDFALVRYQANGALDLNFDADGKVLTDLFGSGNEIGLALALQADGKIVVAVRVAATMIWRWPATPRPEHWMQPSTGTGR